MTVALDNGVKWINECVEHDDTRHEHVSVYLLECDASSILIDSGSFHHRQSIREKIENLTEGSGLDGLLLSHSDMPHSSNVRDFTSVWDDVDLLVSTGSPTQGLPETAMTVEVGSTETILNRKFSFIDPPLADRNHTMWIYDHKSGVLFTVDGFGSYHVPNDCNRLSNQYSSGIDYEDIYEYHKDTLVWLKYVDPEKLRIALNRIFDEYEISHIAPVHGPPVVKEDIDLYLDRFMQAVESIEENFTLPVNL